MGEFDLDYWVVANKSISEKGRSKINGRDIIRQQSRKKKSDNYKNEELQLDFGAYPLTPWLNKINDKNQTRISLEIQPPGVLTLPLGSIELERNGVNLVPTDRPPDLYTPTFYWDGEKFFSIGKEGD